MSETKTPGLCARHMTVTPTCRENRGDEGAVDEALARLRQTALGIIEMRGDRFKLHFVLTMEREVPRG